MGLPHGTALQVAMTTSSSPQRLHDLLQGEHTVILAIRSIACGAGSCRILTRQFDDVCGPMGAQTLNALTVFVQDLARHGRRRITLGAPGCCGLSQDERLILAIFGAAQAEDYSRLDAHLAWIAAGEPSTCLGGAVCLVAEAFAMNGLVLRAPDPAAPPARGRPCPVEPARAAQVPGWM